MPKKLPNQLVAAAIEARQHAVAPYSGFQVGAALLTDHDVIIRGANVESVSYGLTCCAERVALFKALSDGHRHFLAAAVAARCDGGPMPCGACRQLLYEYAPRAEIWVVDCASPSEVRTFLIEHLLPEPFRAWP